MRLNKKAFSGDAVLWVARIIGTIFIIGMIVYAVFETIEKNLDIDDLRFYPVAERFLYSENCFASENEGRVFPGILEADRFNQDSINRCMSPLAETIGAKITLKYRDKETVLYYNQDYFEDIMPLTFSKQYVLAKKRYFVLVEEGKENIPGNMLVEVAWRK